MRCGMFGKLPAKRDFVALSAPREFLTVWERWVQSGISASRTQLGASWQDAFLRAPIWRFWIGAEVCGATVLGAFMPSVDGVGRYFPLTVFACAGEGRAIPPPELHPQDDWFAAAENFLLTSLEPETTFEALVAALDVLAPPTDMSTALRNGTMRLQHGTIVADASQKPLPSLLADIRVEDHERAYGSQTVWWTLGGDEYQPRAVVERRLPDPYLFSGMLTGSFDALPRS